LPDEETSETGVAVAPTPLTESMIPDPTWTDAQPREELSRNASLETLPGTHPKQSPSPLPQPPQQVKAPLPPGSDEAPKESKEPKPPASVGGGGDESDLDDSASNVVGPGRRDPNYFKFLGFNLTTDVFSQAGGYKALGIVYTMG